MCKIESYKDGSIDLLDVTEMNEIIDMQNENEQRALSAVKRDR
jgi:hypothetical protein